MSIKQAFEPLLNLLDIIENLDVTKLFYEVAQTSEFQDIVIELNTIEQLYEKGETAEGERLEDVRTDGRKGLLYSDKYKALKRRKGHPTDRITLKLTGAFYRSFEVSLEKNNDEVLIQINAQTVKSEENNLREIWTPEILGLSKESIEILSEFSVEMVGNKLENILQKATGVQ